MLARFRRGADAHRHLCQHIIIKTSKKKKQQQTNHISVPSSLRCLPFRTGLSLGRSQRNAGRGRGAEAPQGPSGGSAHELGSQCCRQLRTGPPGGRGFGVTPLVGIEMLSRPKKHAEVKEKTNNHQGDLGYLPTKKKKKSSIPHKQDISIPNQGAPFLAGFGRSLALFDQCRSWVFKETSEGRDGSDTSGGRDEAPSISLGHPGALLLRDKKSRSTLTHTPKKQTLIHAQSQQRCAAGWSTGEGSCPYWAHLWPSQPSLLGSLSRGPTRADEPVQTFFAGLAFKG